MNTYLIVIDVNNIRRRVLDHCRPIYTSLKIDVEMGTPMCLTVEENEKDNRNIAIRPNLPTVSRETKLGSVSTMPRRGYSDPITLIHDSWGAPCPTSQYIELKLNNNQLLINIEVGPTKFRSKRGKKFMSTRN